MVSALLLVLHPPQRLLVAALPLLSPAFGGHGPEEQLGSSPGEKVEVWAGGGRTSAAEKRLRQESERHVDCVHTQHETRGGWKTDSL